MTFIRLNSGKLLQVTLRKGFYILTEIPYKGKKCLHGGCSSVVERQIVVLVVAGSNPVIHPLMRP